ncbi:MAG: ABC transporter ATP-binding protein [Oscillibacter sp.]
MFTLENVSKVFGDEAALRNISLRIGRGLHFIVGASGSGKTTLLNILAGMEQQFEGEAYYDGQALKTLTEREKSALYHHAFGFVWQDFNLLDDQTVLFNVMLPQYPGAGPDEKAARKLLREVKLEELAGQKASTLSGGQKQRVAIARELAKNPRVLLADEPTSALDARAAKDLMALLRSIAKTRTVIVVTHDTTLLHGGGMIYELDKGELCAAPTEAPGREKAAENGVSHRLSLPNACRLAGHNLKSNGGRLLTTALCLLVAATLLLVTLSGAISGSGQAAFDALFATYGDSLLDLSVVGSFTGAGGTNGQDSDQPDTSVTQDIGGLYEAYLGDARVEHLVFSQALSDLTLTLEQREYRVESSGSAPTLSKLTAGQMPTGRGNEVVVPNSFARSAGLSDSEILGKTLQVSGSIYNWDSGEPLAVSVHTTVQIVGVADTTVQYEYNGEILEYSVDDAFFFSKTALEELRGQAGVQNRAPNFTLRAKTPADLIALKDELNAKGIVPLGRFELVEDMVRLAGQTRQQSASAVAVLVLLSLVVVVAAALITAFSRRREMAIYKVSGYANRHLAGVTAAETLFTALGTALVFFALSPVLNLATTALWDVNILNGRLLAAGGALVCGAGVVFGGVTGLLAVGINAAKVLLTGEK